MERLCKRCNNKFIGKKYSQICPYCYKVDYVHGDLSETVKHQKLIRKLKDDRRLAKNTI